MWTQVKKECFDHGAYGQSPFFGSFDHEVGPYFVSGTNGQMSIHMKPAVLSLSLIQTLGIGDVANRTADEVPQSYAKASPRPGMCCRDCIAHVYVWYEPLGL